MVWTKSSIVNVCVFFAHRPCVEFAHRHKTVFVMDCTHKTNKFQMPLLNSVGITSTFKSCNVGFAFLSNESESSYQWALSQFKLVIADPAVLCTDREQALINTIAEVFTHLLCIWHINKNVLTNCKGKFSAEVSSCIVQAHGWNAACPCKGNKGYYPLILIHVINMSESASGTTIVTPKFQTDSGRT
jgi:hypothetical protein